MAVTDLLNPEDLCCDPHLLRAIGLHNEAVASMPGKDGAVVGDVLFVVKDGVIVAFEGRQYVFLGVEGCESRFLVVRGLLMHLAKITSFYEEDSLYLQILRNRTSKESCI